jgi:hypothetical protein
MDSERFLQKIASPFVQPTFGKHLGVIANPSNGDFELLPGYTLQ